MDRKHGIFWHCVTARAEPSVAAAWTPPGLEAGLELCVCKPLRGGASLNPDSKENSGLVETHQ